MIGVLILMPSVADAQQNEMNKKPVSKYSSTPGLSATCRHTFHPIPRQK